VLVALDVTGDPSQNFEELVEFASSVGVSALLGGTPVRLLFSDGQAHHFDSKRDADSLRDVLTLVEAGHPSSGIGWLVEAAQNHSGSAAVVLAQSSKADMGVGYLLSEYATVISAWISAVPAVARSGGVDLLTASDAPGLVALWNGTFGR